METHGFLINGIPVLMGSGGLDTAVEVYIDKRNISLTNAVAESLAGWERIPFDFDGFDVPNPRINRLYWPTGASKFSHVHFLVLDADYVQIKSQADQSNGKVTVSEPGSELSTEMYMLPAVPIFEIGLQKETLWLLTLVDERWHWWSLPNSIRVRRDVDSGAGTTWDEVYDAISTLLDEVITVEQAIEAAFLKPSDLLTSQNQPLPILFDSVNFSLGRELIRRLNGDLVVQTFEAGWLAQEALISGEGGSSVGNLDGLRAGSVIEYKQRSVPETGDVSFPYQTRNRPRPGLSYHSIVTTTLPDGVDVFIDSDDISGSHRLKSTAVAVKLTDDADESTAPTSPSNAAALNTLAGDWWFLLKFRWFARIDVALNGIELVTLNTLMDHVEWCVETGNVETRIHPYMPQQYVDGWHDAGLAYAKSRIESTYQPLNWRNEHITGAYYRKDDVAFDGTFIGIANKDTTDTPALASPDWDVLTTAPFGGNITVEEEDGTPSYPNIDTLIFDQDTGFVVSQPGSTSEALVQMDFASLVSEGIVSIVAQSFLGRKTFHNGVIVLNNDAPSGVNIGLVSDSSVHIATVQTDVLGRIVLQTVGTSTFATTLVLEASSADGHSLHLYSSTVGANAFYSVSAGGGRFDGVYGTLGDGSTVSGGIVTAIGGGGGGGVTSINGLTGAITLTDVDDTNVTLAIGAAGSTITFTMGWTGTLAPARGGTGLDTSASSGVFTVSAGTWSVSPTLVPGFGGTGQNFSTSTGVITVASGTFSALPELPATQGGTGLTMVAVGDLLYGSALDTWAALPAGTNGQVLTLVAGLPAWVTPSSGGITSLNGETGATQTFAKADDTNVTITISSASNVHTFSMGWIGTLASGRGGTGFSTYTKGNIIWASATDTLAKLAPASGGDMFLMTNASGNLVWSPSINLNGLESQTQTFAKADDTNVTLTISSSVSTHTFTIGWSGTLAQSRGGTGFSTYATGDILYASAANTLSKRTIGSAGQVLTVSGGEPTWITPAAAPSAATQADQEAASSTTVYVSPGRQHYHPSAVKGFCAWGGGTPSIFASYNVTSLSDGGSGNQTVNWNTDFSSANYGLAGVCGYGSVFVLWLRSGPAAGSSNMGTGTNTAAADADYVCIFGMGDH